MACITCGYLMIANSKRCVIAWSVRRRSCNLLINLYRYNQYVLLVFRSLSTFCSDMAQRIDVLTGIDYWLDNLMCGVPDLVMCFHLNGVVKVCCNFMLGLLSLWCAMYFFSLSLLSYIRTYITPPPKQHTSTGRATARK